MAEILPIHRWRDDAGLVHHVRDVVGLGVEEARRIGRTRQARCLAGEVRTMCGISTGNDHFVYTHDAPSCLWCVTGVFLGWRQQTWPKDP